MENKTKVSVVIDGKVYMLSGGSRRTVQRIASYVDGKIRELKQQNGYGKLSQEYKNILLSLNITEELFKLQDEMHIFSQEHLENEQEMYRRSRKSWIRKCGGTRPINWSSNIKPRSMNCKSGY